jgi:hypothetical protein
MDKDIITRAICSFRNIESIVVERSTGLQCLRRRSKLYTNTYQHTLLEPRGLNDWPDTVEKLGARLFSAVLEALVRAGTEEVDRKALRCISALGISWQVIERLEPMIPSLRNILSPVNDVALNFRADMNHAFSQPEKDLANLRHFVSLMGMIRRLDLRFEIAYDEMKDFLSLVKGIRWKYLEDVTFGGILFTKSDMIKFIKGHGLTLTDLTLIDMCIRQGGSWPELLKGIRNLGVISNFSIEGKMMTQNVRRFPYIERYSDAWDTIVTYVVGG